MAASPRARGRRVRLAACVKAPKGRSAFGDGPTPALPSKGESSGWPEATGVRRHGAWLGRSVDPQKPGLT